MPARRRLSHRDINRAHAELIEYGVVHMKDRAQAAELVACLPARGRPYFVKGGRVRLGSCSRDVREARLGPAPEVT